MNSVNSYSGNPTWRVAQAMMDTGAGMGAKDPGAVADPNAMYKAGASGLDTMQRLKQAGAQPFGGGINGLLGGGNRGFASGAPSVGAAPWINPDTGTMGAQPGGLFNGGLFKGLFGGG